MNRKFKLLLGFAFMLIFSANLNAQTVSDWNGFGGNETNSKISYAKTPTSKDDINVTKTIKGTGYVMDPIIYNDMIYAVNSGKLVEYTLDGEKTSREASVSVGFFSKIAAGDNKIFVASKNNIIAFDLDTFTQVWQTEKITNAQALSAITYYNGYIYSGHTINPSSSGTPSKGFFFAVSTKDEDTSKIDEIKDYTWTYPKEDKENGVGYYWSDAAIANGAVVFAGDEGKLISHHLTQDIIYDSYQLSSNADRKKVRSTIVFDKRESNIYVGTQDSKEIYRIKMLDRVFDRTNIKVSNQIQPLSGGLAVTDNNIYASSGGMYGLGFSVLDKNLNLIGTEMKYSTQSIPLVSEGVNGATYVYFLDYGTGKLVIAKDLNNGKMPTFSEYTSTDLAQYNSFSVIASQDGRLVVPYNSFSSGGFVLMDSKVATSVSDIESLINKAKTMNDYTEIDKLDNINLMIEKFKDNNPDVTISNEADFTAQYDTIKAKVANKVSESAGWVNKSEFLKLENNYTILSNLETPNSTNYDKHGVWLTDIWKAVPATPDSTFSTTYKKGVVQLDKMIGNDENKAIQYQAYIVNMKNTYKNLTKQEEISEVEPLVNKMYDLIFSTTRTVVEGDTTYSYVKKSGVWYLSNITKNNSSLRNISYYVYDKSKCKTGNTAKDNCSRKTKDYKETKSGSTIKRKQTITYNGNVQVIKNLIQDRNSKGKYISTYYNTRSYHSNKRLKASTVSSRHINTNKYTSIKSDYYYSNGKKQRTYTKKYSSGKYSKITDARWYSNAKKQKVATLKYSKGKKSAFTEYRYNKKGQLKSNKYGKAYYTKKTYKKGKLKKTLKYKYNSKGKKIRIK